MAELHSRVDLELISTSSTELVDIGEKGGIQNAHVLIEYPNEDSDGDPQGGTVTIYGTETEGGTATSVDTVTVPASGTLRMRIPINWPRFISVYTSGATLKVLA